MNSANHCNGASKRCSSASLSAGEKMGLGDLEREVAARAVAAFRNACPEKTAENLAAALKLSLRQAYNILGGGTRLTGGQIAAMDRHCGGGFGRQVLEPVAHRHRTGEAA